MTRILDILLLIFFSPLILIIIFFIIIIFFLFGSRPFFYISNRIGKNFISIRVYKFRSMIADSNFIAKTINEYGFTGFEKIPLSSPVYTNLGRFIEFFQFVEFPQFLNVLIGNFSLVGNRPLPANRIEELISIYGYSLINERQSCQAGITGLSQILGKFDLSDNQRILFEASFGKFLATANSYAILQVYFLILINTFCILTLKRYFLLRRIFILINDKRIDSFFKAA